MARYVIDKGFARDQRNKSRQSDRSRQASFTLWTMRKADPAQLQLLRLCLLEYWGASGEERSQGPDGHVLCKDTDKDACTEVRCVREICPVGSTLEGLRSSTKPGVLAASLRCGVSGRAVMIQGEGGQKRLSRLNFTGFTNNQAGKRTGESVNSHQSTVISVRVITYRHRRLAGKCQMSSSANQVPMPNV
jgi:hypothetical protein